MKRLATLALVLLTGCGGVHVPQTGPRHTDLTIPQLREVQIPEYERLELANGLVVYLLEEREFPMVEVRTITRGGDVTDPANKVGLAALAATVVRTGGSERYPGDRLDEQVERMGTNLSVSATSTTFTSSLSTLTENLDEGLTILSDILRNPAFPVEKLDEARAQERTSIASRNDDALSIAQRELAKLVFGAESPYGRHTEYATIDAITVDDLRDVHRRYFHPEQTVLVAWGDFDAAEMRTKLEGALGDWPAGGVAAREIPPVSAETPGGLYQAEKTDVTQATILVGSIGIQRDDPIYPAAMVMQEALGGSFGSRLFDEIRTRRGLAYAAGSFVQAPLYRKGIAAAYVFTQADSTATTLRVLLDELERIREEPVSEVELQSAKDGLLNSFVFQFDSRGEVLLRQARYELNGYPADFLASYQEGIRSATAADVQDAARKLFRPETWKIIVIGNPEDFAEPLSSVMAVNDLDITIPAPAPSREVPDATPETLAAGADLVAQAIQAHGGSSAVGKIHRTRRAGSGKISVQGMTIEVGFTEVFDQPDRLFTEQQVMGQTVRQVLVGDEGWRSGPGGTQDLPAEEIGETWREQIADGGPYFLKRASKMKIQALSPEELDGRLYNVLYVADEPELGLRLYLDPESNLIVRTEHQGNNPMTGAPATITTIHGAFRAVRGVQLPHESTTLLDGEEFARVTVEEFEINGDLAEDLFTRP